MCSEHLPALLPCFLNNNMCSFQKINTITLISTIFTFGKTQKSIKWSRDRFILLRKRKPHWHGQKVTAAQRKCFKMALVHHEKQSVRPGTLKSRSVMTSFSVFHSFSNIQLDQFNQKGISWSNTYFCLSFCQFIHRLSQLTSLEYGLKLRSFDIILSNFSP